MYIRLMFVLLLSFNVSANEVSPAERMLNAMGIDQVLDQTRAAQIDASKDQVAMMMNQLKGTLSKLSPERRKEIEALFTDMMNEILNSWSTEEAIKVYSQVWADNYSSEQILAIAEKYEQPQAKEELQMLLKASEQLNNYIMASYNQSMEQSMASFIPKMQSIIQQGLKENATEHQ